MSDPATRMAATRIGRGMIATLGAALLFVLAVGVVTADDVTPSDNETNQANGWSHFVVEDTRIGEVDITFHQPRWFAACFEYRIDGAEPQSDNNFNTDIEDGLWPFVCLGDAYEHGGTGGDPLSMTVLAEQQVEIRLVFGAERSERFDWTSVEVLPDAQTKADCREDFAAFGFDNQGRCIQFVNTGRDSR